MEKEKIVQTAGRDALGSFAPDFARYNDDVLFGEVWNDTTLDLKTKSTIVISVFMGRGLCDSSLKYHLLTAKKNGITKDEIPAIITHAAFYAGWPMAWAVFNMAKEIWNDDAPACDDKERFQKEVFLPIGEKNPYGKYFTGQSYLAQVSSEQVPAFNVTFEPGCRNFWHIHHAKSGGGQMLICIGGRGWYQEEGKEAVELTPGKVVNIPAGVKHWHGAAADFWMSHLAFEIPGEGGSTEWCEPVSDKLYGELK